MWSRKGRGDGTSQPKATCTKNEDCVAFKSEPKNDKKKSPGLIFLQLQNRRQGLTDVVIECQDGSFFRVHQHILLATSPGFQNLLGEEGDYDDGHIIIAAPKFSFREIARILFLIYCGKTMVIGEEEQELLDEGLYVFFYKESLQNRLDPYPLRSLGRPKLNEMLKEFKDMYLRFTWVENRSKRDYFICCNGDIKVAADVDLDSSPSPSDEKKSNTSPEIIYKRPVNRPQRKRPILDPNRSFQRRNISNIVLADTTISPNQFDHASTSNDDDSENPESESEESSGSDGSFRLQKCTSEFLASAGYKKNCNKRKTPEEYEISSKKTKNKRAAGTYKKTTLCGVK